MSERRRWQNASRIGWLLALGAISLRLIGTPQRGTTFDLYRLAGEHWVEGAVLYSSHLGFVYSPLIAALLAPFSWVPRTTGALLWLSLNAGIFLLGLEALGRARLFAIGGGTRCSVALLLLLPLCLGNLDVAQANPLDIGLIMLAVAYAKNGRSWPAAFLVALAVYLKLYPLAIGLLFLVATSARFTLPFLMAMTVLGLFPFSLQRWQYVIEQYHSWLATRVSDNRLEYSDVHAPLDFWYLLTKVAGLHVSPVIYRVVQMLSGGAAALYIVVGRWRGWPPRRIWAGLFCFGSIWMTLFGPATEGLTYLVLAPAVTLAALQKLPQKNSSLLRLLGFAALALLLLAVAKNSLAPKWNQISWLHGIQPMAALIFLCYCLLWLLDDRSWTSATECRRGGDGGSVDHPNASL